MSGEKPSSPPEMGGTNMAKLSLSSSTSTLASFSSKSEGEASGLVQRVRTEYDKIINDVETKRKEDNVIAWRENSKKMAGHQTKESMWLNVPLFDTDGWHDYQESCDTHQQREKEASIVFQGSKVPSQGLPIRRMENVKALPNMFTWTSIPQNVMAKNELVLQNIPYLGEEELNKKEFIKELLADCYNNKLHAERESKLSDEVFFALANAVDNVIGRENQIGNRDESTTAAKIKKGGSQEKSRGGGTNQPVGETMIDPSKKMQQLKLPNEIVFQAIAEAFPGQGTAPEMSDRYVNLDKLATVGLLPEFNANIDGPHAKSVSRAKVMHSFHHLFCRRCFKYDCLLHRDMQENVVPKMVNRKTPEYKTTLPCGPQCYWHSMGKSIHTDNPDTESADTNGSFPVSVAGFSGAFETRNKKAEIVEKLVKDSEKVGRGLSFDRKSEDNEMYRKPKVVQRNYNVYPIEDEPSFIKDFQQQFARKEWSAAEQSLFRAVQKVYGTNYCLIAKALMSRTCEQVYDFAQKEAETYDINQPEAEMEITSSMKNKNSKRKGKVVTKVLNNYVPCNHEGPCNISNSECACSQSKIHCEKFCFCSSECSNRFPGCRCKAHCTTKACACYFATRECDPDLCLPCGASEHDVSKIRCKNVNCQKGLTKHLLLAESDAAGWGVFIKDGAQKNEFISEYCGEVITQDEANRRGRLYDKCKCSFLFNLNNEYVVDSTRKGNKIRFANHSENPNCSAKILKVNGEHRIGIFAKRLLQPGEELFLDYGYQPTELGSFGIERKPKLV